MGDTKVYLPSVEDFGPFDEWSALEKRLWAACEDGRGAELPGKGGLPEDTDDPDRRVRARLIRYLMWGGSDEKGGARPHPKGVHIVGAWIEEKLDLEGCRSTLDLKLVRCRLSDAVTLQDASLGGLYLPGCHVVQPLNLTRLTT